MRNAIQFMLKENHDAVRNLVKLATELIEAIRSATTQKSDGSRVLDEAVGIIQNYSDRLHNALVSGSTMDALKGVNLMTGVNRGLNESVFADSYPVIGDLGKKVSDTAISVAKSLREELGTSDPK